ncbi:1,4-alpha-glucan branching protein GlgB [Pararhodobacter oceanensis]|uniref:1,4-alpha-glucan branching protein GlgB n=1 Tax=Pararhodobacter oceanensis TaxID=2172121 RepID=UPI003A9561C7
MDRAKNSLSDAVSQADITAILSGDIADPFAVFGPDHRGIPGRLLCFDPHARTMDALTLDHVLPLAPLGGGIFTGDIGDAPYRLRGSDGTRDWSYDDPYRFGPVLGDLDLHLIAEGRHRRLWQALGAHVLTHQGITGTHFAVWAPHARRVSVVGEFNAWDGRRAPMRRRNAGVWEIFLPGVMQNHSYQYEVLPRSGPPLLKSDPLAFGAQHPPQTASVVRATGAHIWRDADWMAARATRQTREAPISIYEVHLGSWRHRDGQPMLYTQAAEELVDYVHDMGFTHIEFMPLTEYPFGGSWGYQPTGLYAPTCRHGAPDEFRALIDAAHAKGLGVIMDWVPAHFPSDAHGLAHFDGTPLYEHADPREGFHPDWNTLIYDFGRNEVRNFLSANAVYWLREFHLDGLRVDAVASMLYRDYSRADDAWIPNRDGGRENYEAIDFIQEMNTQAYGDTPEGVMTMAEESTSWPGVTQPVHAGGLGFGFKWNMGWMNDTLRYMAHPPIHRAHHHDLMTFGLVYGFSENFVLPISHDEVVHGKGSMLEKMPGTQAEKFANLRAYYGFMWGHPGKKLLFMGCEFAQPQEWNHDAQLDWAVLQDPAHAGLQRLIRDLNRLYRDKPALHQRDADPQGFQWINQDAAAESVFSWLRWGHAGQPPVAMIANFTPVERRWRLGLPQTGTWEEMLNSDAEVYGGGNRGNLGVVTADGPPHAGQPHSALITLPPLSTLFFCPKEPR